MRKISLILVISLLLLLVFSSCSSKDDGYKGMSFVYNNHDNGDISGPFWIVLYKDGSFQYHESLFSSRIGMGTWEKDENDVVTLTEKLSNDRVRVNCFKMDVRFLTYIADKSDGFSRELNDKAVFTLKEFIYEDND